MTLPKAVEAARQSPAQTRTLPISVGCGVHEILTYLVQCDRQHQRGILNDLQSCYLSWSKPQACREP